MSGAAPAREGVRWPLLGLPVLLCTFAMAFVVESGNRDVGSVGGAGFDALWAAAWLGFPVVGAVILSRRGHHPIGWLMYAVGWFLTLGLLSNGVAIRHVFVEPVPLVGPVFTWMSFWVIYPAFGLPCLFLLLFPSGRASGWRRRLVGLAAGVIGAVVIIGSIQPFTPLDAHGIAGERLVNPVGLAALEAPLGAAFTVLSVTIVGITLLGILDLVRRLFRGDASERQQIKWVAFAPLPFPVLMTIGGFAEGTRYQDLIVALAFFISLNGVAAAVLIAITRYRLYEIDRVVSRALGWTVLTAILVGLYLGGVLAVTQVLRPLGVSSDLAVAASTLGVAAAFSPLRRRVQGAVDRRFNRARYDAERTVAAFREQLRHRVDLEDVPDDLLETALRSLSPTHGFLWLRPTRGGST
jgi:hypothetical membrane protein